MEQTNPKLIELAKVHPDFGEMDPSSAYKSTHFKPGLSYHYIPMVEVYMLRWLIYIAVDHNHTLFKHIATDMGVYNSV